MRLRDSGSDRLVSYWFVVIYARRCRSYVLEFDVEVGDEELVLVDRVDPDRDWGAAGSEIVVDAPAVVPGDVKDDGVAQRVTSPDDNAVHVLTAIEDIVVH